MLHKPLFVTVAALATPALSQTYVVDQLNQAGAHFTDLPQAIAAVPSGAVLFVRPGTYSPFTLQNKSLTIVGTAYVVTLSSAIVIGPLPASDRVHISGLSMLASSTAGGPSFELRNCAGQVLVDRSGAYSPLPNAPVAPWLIDTCANVHIYECAITQPANVGVASTLTTCVTVKASSVELANSRIQGMSFRETGQTGGTGIQASLGSRLVLVMTSVRAGTSPGGLGSKPPGTGGTAIVLSGNSTLDVSGNPLTPIAGGVGSLAGNYPWCAPGGDGISLTQAATARVLGVPVTGGSSCLSSAPGLPFRADATASYFYDGAAAPPRAEVSGSLLAQSTLTLTLHSRPGLLTALYAGTQTTFQQHALLSIGVLALPASSFVSVFGVPANGDLAVPVQVPPGIGVGTFVLGQFLTYDVATSSFEASNSFAAVARQ